MSVTPTGSPKMRLIFQSPPLCLREEMPHKNTIFEATNYLYDPELPRYSLKCGRRGSKQHCRCHPLPHHAPTAPESPDDHRKDLCWNELHGRIETD